jgi:hypothetical protein
MRGENDWYTQLLGLLPAGWEAKAKATGALRRRRGIQTAADLLRLILLYMTEGVSFAGTVALARLSEIAEISKVALYKRLRNSGAWLQWLCQHVYRQAGLAVEKPEWLKGREVIIVDGSETVKCGVRRQCYMLHYSMELFTLDMRELLVTDMKTGEKLANFTKFKPGDIVRGDRAYGNLPGIACLKRQGVDYVVRIQGWKHAFFDAAPAKIDLLAQLSVLQPGERADIPVQCLVNGRHEQVRVCALRKDTDSERAGIKRLKKENQRKRGGKPVSEAQGENNQYIIVATSLETEIPSSPIMELYRARWQIELAFKRLKSLFQYNDVPMQNSESAFAWFYGKLLLAALCETLVNTGRFSPSGRNGKRGRACAP